MNILFNLIEYLQSNNVVYEIIEHPPLYTMNDVENVLNIPYENRVKSLFIKNIKLNSYNICGISAGGKINFRKLSDLLSVSRSSLRIAAESEYEDILQIPCGSLGIIVRNNKISVFLSNFFINTDFLCFGTGDSGKTIKISQTELGKVQKFTYGDIENLEG